jgi:hypothetical protein
MGRLGTVGVFAILMLGTTRAAAEPTAAEKETARSLMAEGRELRDHADLKAALKRFETADEIMHVPTTGLEVARTQAALGLLVEARETVRRIARLPEAPSDPVPFREARAQADKLDEELQRRIGAIRFEVRRAPGDPDPMITVDGVPILAAVVDVPFRLNPGRHVVFARAGTKEVTQAVDAREAEILPVVLDLGKVEPVVSEPSPSAAAPTASRGWPTVTYIGFGVAAAGATVGAVTGFLAMTSKKAAERGCVDGRCPPSTWPDLDRMDTYTRVSTASFIAGGLGAACGITTLLVLRRNDATASAPSRRALRVAPMAGGLSFAGDF